MSREENLQTIERMWAALSAQDWETLKGCLDPEVQYEDVPTEDTGATGPENTVRRLRIAFDHLWTFKTGETATNRFATVHQMRAGKIYRWSDIWDVNKFVSQFPAWFLEIMAAAHASDFGGEVVES